MTTKDLNNPTSLASPVEEVPAHSSTRKSSLRGCLWMLHHWRLTLILIGLIILTLGAWRLYKATADGEPLIGVKHTTTIAQTPEEITALRNIGQWEFLAAPCEELIERHEAHTFGDKHIVRIYRGTVRIGIDMQKAGDDWFQTDNAKMATASEQIDTSQNTTAILTLPDVALLDSAFIDEARTTTFYEDGAFNAKIKKELYDEAVRAMIARTITPENLDIARQTAKEQFTHIFQALGYEKVIINFTPNP